MSDAPMEISGFGGGLLALDGHAIKGSQVVTGALAGMKKPALQGWAATYGTPHAYKGNTDIFAPGVFRDTLEAKSVVRFQLDHDDDFIVADTSDRLELHSDEKGLGFRLTLNDNGLGEMVKGRKFDAVSVAYAPIETKTYLVDGKPWRLIKKARLAEISLVRRGAVKQAFATLVDAADLQPLAMEMKGSTFGRESAYRNMMRLLEDLGDR
jgi:HK97 family phage prohead protease